MNLKRIGVLLMITLFLFGCPGGDSGTPPDETGTTPTLNQVIVTFDVDGGTPIIDPISINQGSSLGAKYPANPRKTDCAFAGWYEVNDIIYKTKYSAATPILNDIILKARWGLAPTSDFAFGAFTQGANTNVASVGEFNGKTGVTKISPKETEYAWNVMTYNLESAYMGKEITITMDMWLWVSNDAKIVWQINSKSASAVDAWGGSYKIIAGDDKVPLSKEQWLHLQGSATGTPKSGADNGNQVYLSGGGSGGQLSGNAIDIYIAEFSMIIADNSTPILPNSNRLTIGQKKDLNPLLNANMIGTVTWGSSDPSKVSVNNGIVTSNLTSFTTAEDGAKKYTASPATASVTITATAGDNTQTFTIIATTEAQEYIMDLPPLKNHFPSSFLVGNIATTNDAGSVINNAKLTRHFNALTSENDMKPSALSDKDDPNTYKWTNADKFVNAAAASGFKVIGHTLLWHQQIPTWQVNMKEAPKETALAAMKKYITDVVTHFKGKIYSWDVLNEAFPDDASGGDWKTAMRQENPWFKAISYEFVYEAYLAARKADSGAILYYNDFNTDQSGKATLIRDMVREVNQKYLTSGDKPAGEAAGRLLIEGIGMQEHHNLGVSASSIRTTLNLFKDIGVKVAVSEIDVLGYQSYSDINSAGGQGANKHTSSNVTNNQLLTQAQRYKEYMAVYMEFKDIIERISIWGVTDNSSWRSSGLPLLFDPNGKAKPAYYKFVEGIPTP